MILWYASHFPQWHPSSVSFRVAPWIGCITLLRVASCSALLCPLVSTIAPYLEHHGTPRKCILAESLQSKRVGGIFHHSWPNTGVYMETSAGLGTPPHHTFDIYNWIIQLAVHSRITYKSRHMENDKLQFRTNTLTMHWSKCLPFHRTSRYD
jgi:hypothetical protein